VRYRAASPARRHRLTGQPDRDLVVPRQRDLVAAPQEGPHRRRPPSIRRR
jgi:hypothetical protein